MRVTQMHKIHMIKLSKYTTSKYLSEVVRRYETNKENNSLLNRMLEL
jgi:hypothetical protein